MSGVGGVEPETVGADNDLIGQTDAMVWAERFVLRATADPEIPKDVGTMLAWFSSAIMAGVDSRASALRLVEEELRQERDLRRRAEQSRENANRVLRQAREERNAIAGLYNAMQSAREELAEERDRAVGTVFDTRDSLDAAVADRDRLAAAIEEHRAAFRACQRYMDQSIYDASQALYAALSPVQGEHEQDGEDAGVGPKRLAQLAREENAKALRDRTASGGQGVRNDDSEATR